MRFIRQLFYISIYTNLLIACAAMAQCAMTYFVFDQAIDYPIVVIEGAATLLLYNFSLLWSKPVDPQASKYARTKWVFAHEWLLWFNAIIAAAALLWCLFYIQLWAVLFLGGIGVISVLYGLPLFRYENRKVGLRQLPGAKIFHIAFIWVCSSVVLPYVELYAEGVQIDTALLSSLSVLKFLFLIICTLPFDIRDIAQDSYYHLKTLPNMLGERNAKRLCYLLLSVHAILLFFTDCSWEIKISLFLTDLIIAIFLRFLVFKKQGHYHYTYLLDLSLILQFVLVWGAVALF
ncbi:hypothetical protein [Sphingobacterium sp. SYP-B4668]|uniref:hypothetical protein n=1 Tax=Sphingobacterium sp. SYP-B4668 TaxID=2996035 RepID=UPI0022DD315D|nr:hypothetical protein [Sphingobacterium sp. SYP-B4668]